MFLGFGRSSTLLWLDGTLSHCFISGGDVWDSAQVYLNISQMEMVFKRLSASGTKICAAASGETYVAR